MEVVGRLDFPRKFIAVNFQTVVVHKSEQLQGHIWAIEIQYLSTNVDAKDNWADLSLYYFVLGVPKLMKVIFKRRWFNVNDDGCNLISKSFGICSAIMNVMQYFVLLCTYHLNRVIAESEDKCFRFILCTWSETHLQSSQKQSTKIYMRTHQSHTCTIAIMDFNIGYNM